MSSSVINPYKSDQDPQTKSTLTRNATMPANVSGQAAPRSPLQRQTSAAGPSSSSSATLTQSYVTQPVNALTDYLKYILGFNAKTTKRSLSEEAECGSPESLSEWLRQGSSPNEIDAYGYTPLINASLRGCVQSVKILLKNGAEVNMKAMHGYVPLHAAAQVSPKRKKRYFLLSTYSNYLTS